MEEKGAGPTEPKEDIALDQGLTCPADSITIRVSERNIITVTNPAVKTTAGELERQLVAAFIR